MSSSSITIEDGVNGYVDLCHFVLNNGHETAPRGMKTLEIEDAVVRIEDVFNTLPLGVGRGAVPGIAAVEALQLLASQSVPQLVTAIAPNFKRFMEPDGTFHGAYGVRTDGQYQAMVERLKEDPDTRQAVVTLWNPELDLQSGKKDYPCTILHQFRIRNNKLNMTVFMRSNDVWLGSAYDFAQFTRVQIAMASILGIEPGAYVHHAGSLHIYEQHYDAVAKLQKMHDKSDYEPFPAITGSSWADVGNSAAYVLEAAAMPELLGDVDDLNETERWYYNAMTTAAAKQKNKALAEAAAL